MEEWWRNFAWKHPVDEIASVVSILLCVPVLALGVFIIFIGSLAIFLGAEFNAIASSLLVPGLMEEDCVTWGESLRIGVLPLFLGIIMVAIATDSRNSWYDRKLEQQGIHPGV